MEHGGDWLGVEWLLSMSYGKVREGGEILVSMVIRNQVDMIIGNRVSDEGAWT